MVTLFVVTAFLAPSVLIVSACMLSSRLSQEEEFVEYYETSNSNRNRDMDLVSAHSRS